MIDLEEKENRRLEAMQLAENRRLEAMQLAMAELLGWTKLKRNKRGILIGLAPRTNNYQGARPSAAGEWPWIKAHLEWLLEQLNDDEAYAFDVYLRKFTSYSWKATAAQLTEAYLQMKGKWLPGTESVCEALRR